MATNPVHLPDELEQALLNGLSSGPAKPWTDEEWQAIKTRVVASDDQQSSY